MSELYQKQLGFLPGDMVAMREFDETPDYTDLSYGLGIIVGYTPSRLEEGQGMDACWVMWTGKHSVTHTWVHALVPLDLL